MPQTPIPPGKRSFAKTLRRDMTEAEGRLWEELRGRRLNGLKFRRQVPVGSYVADFLCADSMLIVEVDGSQHADSMHDRQRAVALKVLGFRVLRFWNDEVLHEMSAACDTIIAYAADKSLEPWR
ncbi:MAG TPA: DUF559 domain-containing protein [Mesorhizobium sp.]|jgi:very-short-patch-repair endonuclease|uniref:endonuclease domain-containing protein n=1 Tax=Mesorhizobium sp. TaxID=1871066 RepID=UPI002DDD9483|nr:DUF559 domain-containing protein [Mesorhizobium sp.]HEV2507252.1 DUF559 domain-containing protein [Mesorhizobium sp.]